MAAAFHVRRTFPIELRHGTIVQYDLKFVAAQCFAPAICNVLHRFAMICHKNNYSHAMHCTAIELLIINYPL